MTKHNLQQSLAWLLRQPHPTLQNLDHTSLPAISSSPVTDDAALGASQEMARLQLAPQTGARSRLLAHNGHNTGLPTPDPSRPSIDRSYPPPATSPRRTRAETPLENPAQRHPKTPASAYEDSVFDSDILDIDDVERVDLTSCDPNTSSFATFGTPERLWDEDVATRIWPLSEKRGKKRKSDEYQEDLVSPRPRQGTAKRKGAAVHVTSTAFQNGPPVEDFDDEGKDEEGVEDLSPTQKPVPTDVAQKSPVRQTILTGSDHKGKYAVRNHVWSEQEKESILSATYSVLEESIPDSDADDGSPIRKSEPEPTQRHLKIEEPLSGLPPQLAKAPQHKGTGERPEAAEVKTEQDSTSNLRVSIKQNSSQVEQKLPTPPVEQETAALNIASGFSAATNTPSEGFRLSAADQAIITMLMDSGAEGIRGFLQRLEKSKKETHITYAELVVQGDAVPEWLKSKRKTIAQRVVAANKLLELHVSYAKIIKEKESCKERLMEMLDNDEDVEDCPLLVRTRELKAEGHAQEVAILTQMRAAGLEDRSPSVAVGVKAVNSSPKVGRAGVLVASTQKVPLCSSRNMSQLSPSRRHESACESVVQTPMPSMSTRRGDSFSIHESRAIFKSRTESPKKLTHLLQPQFPQRDVSRPLPPAASERRRNGFTTNMCSPSRSCFPEDNFDEAMEDDDDMLNMADAFEQGHTNVGLSMPQSEAPRAPLYEMSDNVRRNVPPPASPMKEPSASQQSHPWSRDVLSALKKRFHLHGFRHNQLEAINATLGGEDAFVLMPTGGGKSLCYQLPSIVQSGRTNGVTIVISPLLSLMQDQVDHLQKLKIQAFLINSEVTAEHKRMVFQALGGPVPERFIQLLYVTPEMLSKSAIINRVMDDLHKRKKLARIVIDEAHCVSQWGHDFRPDYKDIGNVRNRFRGVPAMALTATATENVKVDVMHNLGMDGCQVFTQSFNRPNLTYEVRPKVKGLEGIAQIINSSYHDQSGIIYCLSRKSCEAIAGKLSTDYGISAAYYHAALEPQQKADVQKRWQAGQHKVIVATIAFGMGIDKPDVRFVIHHSIPKSLEGYYQETGRAGRDGQQSGCYLYYNYGDTMQLKRMINDSEGSEQQKERQRQMLRNVVQYCENRSDCRRVQVLAYFNERFPAEQCQGGCDNCNSNSTFETRDFTSHARHATDLVRQIQQDDVTLLHCVDVYRGSKNTKISNKGHDQLVQYGLGKDLERGDCERLFQRLVSEDALLEIQKTNKAGFTSGYIKLGDKMHAVARGQLNLRIQVRISPNGKSKAKPTKTRRKKTTAGGAGTGVRASAEEYPASTNISSPLQPRSRQPRRQLIVQSDDEEEEMDQFEYFEPVRDAGQPVMSRRRQSGAPITLDDRIESLDEVHRHTLNDFVEESRKLVEQVMMDKDLRRRPVADTVLREIAIEFPSTKQAMLEIHGMTEDKYEIIGAQLLRLVKIAHKNYKAMTRAKGDVPDKRSDRDVVEISDDEGGFVAPDSLNESDDSEFDESESSRYFSANGDVGVGRSNNQTSEIRTLPAASKATISFQKSASRSRSGSSSFRRARGGKKTSGSARNYRPKSNGTGVRKKKSSTNSRPSTGNASINAYASKRSGGGVRGVAAAGIGMMPT